MTPARAPSVLLLPMLLLALAAAPPGARADDGTGESPEGSSLVPIPILFYTPETRLAFGGSALYALETRERIGGVERSSTLSGVLILTLESQVLSVLGATLHPTDRLDRLEAVGSYRKFPAEFYGIGNDVPTEAEEIVTPEGFSVGAAALRDLGRGWLLGPEIEVSHTALVEVERGGAVAAAAVPGARGGWDNAVGVRIERDTRDSEWFPRRGLWLQAAARAFPEFLGSDHPFEAFTVDARAYRSLGGEQVLAARLLGEFRTGEPPFHLLPGLGGAELLRGTYEQRFRDRQLVAAQIEVRRPLVWKFDMAVFLAAGRVARDVEDLALDGVHVGGGWGLRFPLVEERDIRLRADFGYGEETSGFYIAFGEAF